jgi:hypothetical protein
MKFVEINFKTVNFEKLDIDECIVGQNECQKNTECVNTIGSYKCKCREGFSGNGLFCQGKQIIIISN